MNMKIEAKSLRLGNLFQEKYTGQIIEVVGIDLNGTTFTGSFKDKWQAQPIQLNEEWLIKLGFSKHDDGGYFNNVIPHHLNVHLMNSFNGEPNLNLYDVEDNFTLGNYVCGDSPVQYVHQLQNLFFALTYKELGVSCQ